MNKTEPQADQILHYLKSGKTLTQLEALRLFKTLRLGARIHELKARGYDIKSQIVPVDNGSKHVARYSL